MTVSSLRVFLHQKCASVVNGNGRARRFAYYFAFLFLGICTFALPLKELIGMSLLLFTITEFSATGLKGYRIKKYLKSNIQRQSPGGMPVR